MIPRLELCGALLLVELMDDTRKELEVLNIKIEHLELFYWCDSTNMLAWIGSELLFQFYVSYRIARIRDTISPYQWQDVSLKNNLADLITRSVDAESMCDLDLWWIGLHCLSQERSCWPNPPILPEDLPEVRAIKLALIAVENKSRWILKKYSNWNALIRITALVRRFVTNCKYSILKQNEKRIVGFINIHELAEAKRFWLADAQSHVFSDELTGLRAGGLVHRGSALTSLNPFIEDHGLIRVGGRLTNAHVCIKGEPLMLLPERNVSDVPLNRLRRFKLMQVCMQRFLNR